MKSFARSVIIKMHQHSMIVLLHSVTVTLSHAGLKRSLYCQRLTLTAGRLLW